MVNHKIQIRRATIDDSQSIFDWRNDKNSRPMFFNEQVITMGDHIKWFESALADTNRKLFIGEIFDEKIGVCRFDLDKNEFWAEVSINMNPESRGRGLGKIFLLKCIEYYLESNTYNLVARIKPKNHASLKVFNNVGFEQISVNEEVICLLRPVKKIVIEEVAEENAEDLFELLVKRDYSISHVTLPSEYEHLEFVKSSPYRYWAIVLEEKRPIGSFYIQNDNSIGLNLLRPQKLLVQKLLYHIKSNFNPAKEIKSKIPPYFYMNVAHANKPLKKVLGELDAVPIQTSYKI